MLVVKTCSWSLRFCAWLSASDSQAQNRSDHEHVFTTNTLYLFMFLNQIINSVRSVHEYFASIPIDRTHDISVLEDFLWGGGGGGILRGLDSNCFHPPTNSSYMVCGASVLILLMLDWAAPSLLGWGTVKNWPWGKRRENNWTALLTSCMQTWTQVSSLTKGTDWVAYAVSLKCQNVS